MNRRNLFKFAAAAGLIAAVPIAISQHARADALHDHQVRMTALIEEMRKNRTPGPPTPEFERLQRAYIEEYNKIPPKPPWERGLKIPSHMTFPGYVDHRTMKLKQIPVIGVNPIVRRSP